MLSNLLFLSPDRVLLSVDHFCSIRRWKFGFVLPMPSWKKYLFAQHLNHLFVLKFIPYHWTKLPAFPSGISIISHTPWKSLFFTRMPNFVSFMYFLLDSVADIKANFWCKCLLWVSCIFWLSVKFYSRFANSLSAQVT